MRSSALLAAVLPVFVAAFDPKLCNNVGGCSQTSQTRNPMPFRCPNGSRQDILQTYRTANTMSDGGYQVVSKAEFPTSCLDGRTPGAADTLAVTTSTNGQKNYYFLSGTCNSAEPGVLDCYSASKNEHKYTLCQVVDSTGANCSKNPRAGKCESYGNVRRECTGWTPAQVEEPCTFTDGMNNCR